MPHIVTYTPSICQKLTMAYHFLDKHPKFEVEFPRDGLKPPSKLPHPIRSINLQVIEDTVNICDPKRFVRHPTLIE